MFALFYLFDLEQNKTKQQMFPASGSKDLAADLTTAVPMNNERVPKLSANNQDIKGTHQNETQVFAFFLPVWQDSAASWPSPGHLMEMQDPSSLP